MGAKIAICNDTPDPWHCKINPDDAWMQNAYVKNMVAATGAALVGVAGLFLPIFMRSTSVTGELIGDGAVLGMQAATIKSLGYGMEVTGFLAYGTEAAVSFGLFAIKLMEDKLLKDNYAKINSEMCQEFTNVHALHLYEADCYHMHALNLSTVRTEHVVVDRIIPWKYHATMTKFMTELIAKQKPTVNDVVAVYEKGNATMGRAPDRIKVVRQDSESRYIIQPVPTPRVRVG